MTSELTQVADGVLIRPMLTIDRAVDVFLSSGLKDTTRASYGRLLDQFCDRFPDDWDVARVTEDDCLTFLGRYRKNAIGTRAHAEAVLGSFFRYLYVSRKIRQDPMDRVQRTRRVPAIDLDVTTVSPADVRLLLAAARPGAELNCVAIAAYLGPRRHALAALKVADYDRERQVMRFREKGGKTIWKPVPGELALILDASIARGDIQDDGYLIPPEGPLARRGARDDRVIWRLVKKVADRAGVDAHVHALRAAFAVHFLETHNRDAVALQELMGHDSFETTRIYLRKLDRSSAMEPVRDMSWLSSGAGLAAASEVGRGPVGETLAYPAPDSSSGPVNGDGQSVSVEEGVLPVGPDVSPDNPRRNDDSERSALASDTHVGQASQLGQRGDAPPSGDIAADVAVPDNRSTLETPQIADARFHEPGLVGAGGFEPPFEEPLGGKRPHRQPDGEEAS